MNKADTAKQREYERIRKREQRLKQKAGVSETVRTMRVMENRTLHQLSFHSQSLAGRHRVT